MIIYTPASSRVVLLDMGFTEDSPNATISSLLCVTTHTKKFFKSAFSNHEEATKFAKKFFKSAFSNHEEATKFATGSQFMTTSEIETFLKLSSV